MKETKAVHVTRHKIRDDQNFVYQLFRSERDDSPRYCRRSNFGCQYEYNNSRKDNVVCSACKNFVNPKRYDEMLSFGSALKHINTYHRSRSYTDIGIGSVKVLQKRKVKRVYLPETEERGVGSSNLNIRQTTELPPNGHYDYKKTSSKCVGGILEYNTGCVINEKLSPIVHTISRTTSPRASIGRSNVETGTSAVTKNFVTISTQFEIENQRREIKSKPVKKVSEQTQKFKYSNDFGEDIKKQVVNKKPKLIDKMYSSDSLVQHVHNLENPSDDKQSRISLDPMENKLEREYRKMFSTTSKESKPSCSKPAPELKSASLFKRRFEALRRGLSKKEDSNKDSVIPPKPSAVDSGHSHKDASVTSDPPSLISRSYSNTKRYSPVINSLEQNVNKVKNIKESEGITWHQSAADSDSQGVRGMFKLWGKRFNLDEENYHNRRATPMPSVEVTEKTFKMEKHKNDAINKKEGKKIFSFKKKSRDRNKETYKSKKDVTAGRCEIRDGLTLKLGPTSTTKEETKSNKSEETEEISRKTWLKRYLSPTIESCRSINIRWNNSMYATSSSTVFELLETVYKNTGVVLQSRSEITAEESFHCQQFPKHRVNFVQDFEMWMIPKTYINRYQQIPIRIYSHKDVRTTKAHAKYLPTCEKEIHINLSNEKWLIDKSEANADEIELLLNSNEINKLKNENSSEYLRIDIPKHFFDVTSSDDSKRKNTSDEEVYKIVEYETESDIKRNKDKARRLEKGDHTIDDIKVIVSVLDSSNEESKILETFIKRPPTQRDVVIQGSIVNCPKRCDVIGVGIITPRDLRGIKNSILKIEDDLSDEESEHVIMQVNQKKCEFAESYLRDYYRNWTPLGIEVSSSCNSESHLRSCSDKSLNRSFHYNNNLWHGSKSCPNIFNDFQASTIVSPCNTSSCSHCANEACDSGARDGKAHVDKVALESKTPKKKSKYKDKEKKNKITADLTGKRILPKDSLEVFKKRKFYEVSNKSQWHCNDKPLSIPSIQSRAAQDPECKKKKRVTMFGRDEPDSLPGILSFGGDATKPKKHACLKPEPDGEISEPPCKPECEKSKKAPCSNPSSPPCSSETSKTNKTNSKLQCGPCYPDKPVPCPASLPSSANANDRTPSNNSLNKLPEKLPLPQPRSTDLDRADPGYTCNDCCSLTSKTSGLSLKSEPHPPKKSPSKSPKRSPCNLPPCNRSQKKASTKYTDEFQQNKSKSHKRPDIATPCPPNIQDDYPWPIKNQDSNKSSRKCISPGCSSPKCAPHSKKKEANACKKQCNSRPEYVETTTECKPYCTDRQNQYDPSLNSVVNKPFGMKSKVPGLVLKKKPNPRHTCSEDCLAWNDDLEERILKLSSRENITVKLKKRTPSNEALRDGMNIKVRDEDGNTLFERKQYLCENPTILNDMYRDSEINRVSTPITVTNPAEVNDQTELPECKSEQSLANLIEIQFKLRITQGDKTTEINIENDKDQKFDKKSEHNVASPEIFLVQNDKEDVSEESNGKNDISIKIVVKNFKTKSSKNDINQKYNVSSKQISDKVHSVSTGYSEVLGEPAVSNVYSMHNTVNNLTSSIDKLDTQSIDSNKFRSKESLKNEQTNLTIISHITKYPESRSDENPESHSTEKLNISDDEIENKSMSSPKDSLVCEQYDGTNTNNTNTSELPDFNDSEDLDIITSLNNTSNDEHKELETSSKEQKKMLLKKILGKAQGKTKKQGREMWDMLKITLTDSSENDDVTSNELLKDVTFTSLKPNYFRDTDSMNNYYQQESTLSSLKESNEKSIELYPTKEDNSATSSYSEDSNANASVPFQGCMCSKIAEKLKVNTGCCCRMKLKHDMETNCDLRTEEDFFLLNYKTAKYVDMETQNSKYFSSKINSVNVSVHSRSVAVSRNQCHDLVRDLVDKATIKIEKKTSVRESHASERDVEQKHQGTSLETPIKDRLVLVNDKHIVTTAAIQTKLDKTHHKNGHKKSADILQSYDAKKAVLQIYAEKTVSEDGEYYVAKLPKFAQERESEIVRNYEQTAKNSYKTLCKKNIFMMSLR